MKRFLKQYYLPSSIFYFAFILVLSSCGKKDANSPGVEFMPDMYRSPSLETYSEDDFFTDSMSTRRPVAGTIPRGYMPYPYANTPEGYELAKANLHNPLQRNDINLKQGEELYGKFCVHCHGATGQGDGAVGLKLPGAPPPYTAADKVNMTEGEIFQIMTYGKGLMGSHSSQLSKEERWKLVLYVQHLQHPDGMPVAVADSAKTEKKVVSKKKKKS